MSSLEIVATIFAFIYIILTIGEFQISWIISMLSSLLYIFLFWKASLYYQSILQIFFIISGFYGWWAWDKKRNNSIRIAKLCFKQNLSWLAASVALTIPASLLLSKLSDSPLPLLDATTAVFSISATILTAHKKLESWYYWIGINIISIWMFDYQKLYLTSLVYIGFLILAIIGLRAWNRKPISFLSEHEKSA